MGGGGKHGKDGKEGHPDKKRRIGSGGRTAWVCARCGADHRTRDCPLGKGVGPWGMALQMGMQMGMQAASLQGMGMMGNPMMPMMIRPPLPGMPMPPVAGLPGMPPLPHWMNPAALGAPGTADDSGEESSSES